MQDQRPLLVAQVLSHNSPANQMTGMFGGFIFPNFPADDIPCEDVQDQIQVIVQTFDRAVEVGYVPGPDLILISRTETGYWLAFWPEGSSAVVLLPKFPHYPVKTGF